MSSVWHFQKQRDSSKGVDDHDCGNAAEPTELDASCLSDGKVAVVPVVVVLLLLLLWEEVGIVLVVVSNGGAGEAEFLTVVWLLNKNFWPLSAA